MSFRCLAEVRSLKGFPHRFQPWKTIVYFFCPVLSLAVTTERVNNPTDQELLRAYADSRSEPAFAELARRHVDLVFSAALRMVRNAAQAEDVTQSVFLALAQNASQLASHPVLSGWLHRTTQNLAANAVRSDVRRRSREQEAAAMNKLISDESSWEQIEPHLDSALSELNETDRNALLLRFFERKSAKEMAQTLGTSEEAAQKRIHRAMERLREIFAKRGIAVGASGLAAFLSANAVQSAPAGLIVTIATLSGTTLATTTTASLKIIAMTTFQKAILTVALSAAVGAGIYETHQVSTLQNQVKTLQQQETPIAKEVETLKTQNERIENQLTTASRNDPATETSTLLNKAAQSKTTSQELATLKSVAAKETKLNTNLLATTMTETGKFMKKEALAKLARMKTKLNLSDSQEQAVKDALLDAVEKQTQLTIDMLSGKTMPTMEQMSKMGIDAENAIKTQLTPEQLAGYPQFTQSETDLSYQKAATVEVGQLVQNYGLSKEQQDQLNTSFFQITKDWAANIAANPNSSSDPNQYSEILKSRLDKQINVLRNYLTAEQLSAYRETQTELLETQAQTMKAFLPQTTRSTNR